MLKVTDLSYQYSGNSEATLKSISLNLQKGEVLGLLGHNGAGKTTLLSLLSGLIEIKSDKIKINTDQPLSLKQATSLVPQDFAFYAEVSVAENLAIFSSFTHFDKSKRKQLLDKAIEQCDLFDILPSPAKTLSGGQKRRLNLAIGLLKDTPILFLDEPTAGIDPLTRHKILDTISTLKEDGKTIIYTSHLLDEVERVCSQLTIINNGEILLPVTSISEYTASQQLILQTQHSAKIDEISSATKLNKIDQITSNRFILHDANKYDVGQYIRLLEKQKIQIHSFYYGKQALENLYLSLVESSHANLSH